MNTRVTSRKWCFDQMSPNIKIISNTLTAHEYSSIDSGSIEIAVPSIGFTESLKSFCIIINGCQEVKLWIMMYWKFTELRFTISHFMPISFKVLNVGLTYKVVCLWMHSYKMIKNLQPKHVSTWFISIFWSQKMIPSFSLNYSNKLHHLSYFLLESCYYFIITALLINHRDWNLRKLSQSAKPSIL